MFTHLPVLGVKGFTKVIIAYDKNSRVSEIEKKAIFYSSIIFIGYSDTYHRSQIIIITVCKIVEKYNSQFISFNEQKRNIPLLN